VANVLATLVMRGFGRQQELQADQLGVLYGSRDSYDPSQLPIFLQRLNQATGGSPPAWLYPLQTHPPVEQRVSSVDKYIEDHQITGSKTDAAAFDAVIGVQP
jgi:predicted Zn-dependent protease